MRLVPIKIGTDYSFWCFEIEKDGEKDEMAEIIEENEIKAFLSRKYLFRSRNISYWVIEKRPN